MKVPDDLRDAPPHSVFGVYATESGRRFFAECNCGYRSTTRNTEEDAEQAALHHYRKAIAEERRNGIDRYRPKPTLVSTTGRARSA